MKSHPPGDTGPAGDQDPAARWKEGAHISALDGLRGFAAAIVFIIHYGGGKQSNFLPLHLFGSAIRIGWSGVTLFFVLSGFLISGILLESFSRPGWWKRFYIRRSLRIFPLYYLSLLWALGIALIWRRELLSIIGVYALYLQDLPWVGSIVDQVPTQYLVLDHFWSLAVEEQFYLIWPFILFFLHRKRTAAIWFCIAACPLSLAFRVWALGVHPAIAGRQPWIYHAPLSHVGELCAGAALALAIRGTVAQRRRILRLAPYFYWSSVVMLAAIVVWTKGSLEYDDPRWITIGTVVLTIFYTFLLALALRPGLIQRFFQIAFLRWLGKISYGIYVYHLLLRPIFVGLAYRIAPLAKGNLQALLVASIATIGTLSVASLSFDTFERFFLDMKSKFPNR